MKNNSGIRLSDDLNTRQMLRPDLLTNGEVEFVIKDKSGNIVDVFREKNIVKIFGKEILSHRVCHSKVWDPTASSGSGAWVSSTVDPDEDYSAKYIIFGASYDANGVALGSNDTRYYIQNDVTNAYVPISLAPGAEYEGGLINPVTISEPDRPLKRIENQAFEATYQPSSTPFLQSDVRALNNILLLETTLESDEYNGLGLTNSDYFTLTEVALVAGKELDAVGQCDCDPHDLFLEGLTSGGAFPAEFTGGTTVTIDSSVSDAELEIIKVGDQIKIVGDPQSAGSTDGNPFDQTSEFYLVVGKSATGRDLELDRVPSNSSDVALTGGCGVYRDTMRILSHRILSTPVTKSSDFEILVRWRIIFS